MRHGYDFALPFPSKSITSSRFLAWLVAQNGTVEPNGAIPRKSVSRVLMGFAMLSFKKCLHVLTTLALPI